MTPRLHGNLFITQGDLAMFATRLLSSVVLVVALPSFGHLQAAEPTTRLVHVTGQGFVRVVPDEVVIRMTITSVDDDLVRVRTHGDDQAHAVLSLAIKHGVKEDRFQVSRLELSLDYSEQLRRQIYQVERDIAIKLHQLANLDGLLSDLLRVPSSKITGITFGTTKAREHRLEALRWAVADAQEKAGLLARFNGLTLGKARDIRVVTESESPFVISVIPAVGSADDRTQGGVAGNSGRAEPRGLEEASSKGPLPAHFVASQASGNQPPQRVKAAEKTTPFGLGLIEVATSVSIDFDLAE